MFLSYLNSFFFNFNGQPPGNSICQIDKGACASCGPSPFFLFTQDFLSEHSHSHTNSSNCLKYSLLFTFSFLLACMVNQTQIYPLYISPGLF